MNWDYRFPAAPPPEIPGTSAGSAHSSEKTRIILPAILFVTTFLTTLLAGFWWHISFVSANEAEIGNHLTRVLSNPFELLSGLPYSCTILGILLAHEMGHYLTCRYYGIRATLPYLIPAPFLFGTFGAVIKIKSVFNDRRQLFDVGIAGPLVGFVLIIPALIVGFQNSTEFVFTDAVEQTVEFGEPLLFQLAAMSFFPGSTHANINLHPIGWAAWFGMLATSINLLPIGQLDGGHIVYAIFGPRGHRLISYSAFGGLIAISLYSSLYYGSMLGYLVFALVLLFLGFRHPHPRTEFIPLGRGRLILAVVGLIVFLLTCIVVPVRFVQHVGQP